MKKLIILFTVALLSFAPVDARRKTKVKSTPNRTEQLASVNSRIDKNVIQKEIEKRIFQNEHELDVLLNDVLVEAKSHLGKRYVWATRGPKTFDCSGFVYYVFKQFGYNFSPSSRNQYTLGEKVERKEAKKGDLIFFHSRKHPNGVGHVGIVYEVLEDGTITFIHASVKKGISIARLEGYYERNFVGIKRVLK